MDQRYYSEYYHYERNHWWFKARLEILKSVVRQQLKNLDSPSILNVGVATGATSLMLGEFGNVTNLEYDEDCCRFLREELNMEVTQASLTDLPYDNHSFDMVCAFDVIEHIEDDAKAVSEISRVLKQSGSSIITVPAFMFLWSHHDVVNHHFRRYTLNSLKSVLSQNLDIKYLSYFNIFLFPPIAAFRLLAGVFRKKQSDSATGSDFEVMKSEGFVNNLLYHLFLTEKPLVNKRISLPFGVSLIAIGTVRN